jgi:5-oxoprolinase (ATP-hydrolysing) subunit A
MILPFGASALRLDLPPDLDPLSVRDRLLAIRGVVEVVVAERHALVTFDPANPPHNLEAALLSTEPQLPGASPRPEHLIRVRYDGPDLYRVAAHAGLTADEVVELHAAREYWVRVVGFLPGFAYLGEIDSRLSVPRLATPRTRVPMHSVGIAGTRTGVYPCASPGGWNLIGTTVDFIAFDPERGAALSLGDRVRFVAV